MCVHLCTRVWMHGCAWIRAPARARVWDYLNLILFLVNLCNQIWARYSLFTSLWEIFLHIDTFFSTMKAIGAPPTEQALRSRSRSRETRPIIIISKLYSSPITRRSGIFVITRYTRNAASRIFLGSEGAELTSINNVLARENNVRDGTSNDRSRRVAFIAHRYFDRFLPKFLL